MLRSKNKKLFWKLYQSKLRKRWNQQRTNLNLMQCKNNKFWNKIKINNKRKSLVNKRKLNPPQKLKSKKTSLMKTSRKKLMTNLSLLPPSKRFLILPLKQEHLLTRSNRMVLNKMKSKKSLQRNKKSKRVHPRKKKRKFNLLRRKRRKSKRIKMK